VWNGLVVVGGGAGSSGSAFAWGWGEPGGTLLGPERSGAVPVMGVVCWFFCGCLVVG
jgi:hypothetical protein